MRLVGTSATFAVEFRRRVDRLSGPSWMTLSLRIGCDRGSSLAGTLVWARDANDECVSGRSCGAAGQLRSRAQPEGVLDSGGERSTPRRRSGVSRPLTHALRSRVLLRSRTSLLAAQLPLPVASWCWRGFSVSKMSIVRPVLSLIVQYPVRNPGGCETRGTSCSCNARSAACGSLIVTLTTTACMMFFRGGSVMVERSERPKRGRLRRGRGR